jgi:transposase InsO family protein
MSRKGNCWDHAVMERFYHSLKSEQVYYADYQTPDEARRDIVDYIQCSTTVAERIHIWVS